MFDPLNTTPSPFADAPSTREDAAPWPATPYNPDSHIPNLRRAASPAAPPTPDKGPTPGLYGKEPQIYGQPDPGLISPRETLGSNGHKYEKAEPYLRVRINGLDRNRRDILIKLDAQTNLSNFNQTAYRNVSRSYFEFQQFYDAIVQSNPHTIVPALPLAQTSAPTDEEDDRLVKIMLQRWITRVCEDPILIHDEDVRAFIESDFGYQPTPKPKRKTSSGFGLMRRHVPDEDEELQRARFELTKLEGQFFETAKAVDRLSIARKTLATSHAEMGNKLVSIATTEAHPPLGNALRKLGRTWHSLADLDNAQAISECVVLGDSLGYQGMNARSAKETLQMRTGVLEEYQSAVKTTISKRRQIERLKASSNIRPDKVDEALEDMREAESYEQTLAKRAEGISQNLHRALASHNRSANDDITTALIEHARSSIMYERQLLKELEALRTDVSNAAKKSLPVAAPPKPMVIPPLEDHTVRPPLDSAPSAPLANGFYKPESSGPPVPHTAVFPQNGTTPSFVPHKLPDRPNPALPNPHPSPYPQSPLGRTEPLSAASVSSFTSKVPPSPHPAFNSPRPQSPGAGPSSPGPYARAHPVAQPLANEPPLGGRFGDGTKSMFVQKSTPGHRPSPLSFSSSAASVLPSGSGPIGAAPAGPTAGGGAPAANQPFDPLRNDNYVPSPLHSGPAGLSQSQRLPPSSGHQHPLSAGGAVDPLSGIKPHQMSSSLRVTARPRLDAREAASKLANMF